MTTVDRNSPVPLYFQLKQILVEQIERSEWELDQPIPSEQELQSQYGLSRTTVRQALSELVVEGRLVRQRGRGTFIARPKLAHSPQRPQGLVQMMLANGIQPGWRVLEIGWVAPDHHVQHQLGLGPDEQALHVRRLRLADDRPIGYHQVWLPAAIGEQINRDALTEGDSLAYLRHLPAIAQGQTRRTIEAVSAEGVEAELLGVRGGEPLLLIQRLLSDAEGAPVELMEARYCGTQFKYQIVLPTAE